MRDFVAVILLAIPVLAIEALALTQVHVATVHTDFLVPNLFLVHPNLTFHDFA